MKWKKGSRGGGRAIVILIQQLYFKTIKINVLIVFHFVDKATRKKQEKFKYSENESQRVDIDQKRELQKGNENLTH